MAEDYSKGTFKILNATITTRDPLTARVLGHARSVKRLNAVLSMIVEAHLATQQGQVLAAQVLQVPLSELDVQVLDAVSLRPAPDLAVSREGIDTLAVQEGSKRAVNFDSLISA